MTTYTDVFGGNTISPTQVGYRAIALTADLTLVWPLDAPTSAEIAAQKMNVTPDQAGWTLTMPDATLVSPGQDCLLYNPSAFTFSVEDSAGGAITTVTAGQSKYLYLKTNSTAAGTWQVITYGVGTSAPDAASLEGLGVEAIATTLNWASEVSTKNANYTLAANDRASTVVNTGGAITFAFTAAATLGAGWIVLIRNAGTGTLTLNPNGAELIDGALTKALAATESCLVVCDGSAFYTVGYGRSTTSTVSAVNISLAGTGTYTESSSETAAQVQNFTGLLTGARIVEFGTAAGYWFVYNNTTGAYTVTCRVNNLDAGAAITQGNYSIVRADGTNLTVAFSATSGTVTSVATGTGITGGPITTTGTISLANTAVTPGSYGSATKALTGTVDAQGRLTTVGESTVTPAFSSITSTPTTLAGYGITDAVSTARTLTAGTGLSGGGDLSANRTFNLANTAVTPGTYAFMTGTVDQQGRLTAASAGTASPTFTGTTTVADLVVSGTFNLLPSGVITDWATTTAPSGWLLCDGSAVSRATYASLFTALVTTPGYTGQTFTVTVASPGVVTKATHGLTGGEPLRLTTTGALPTGLSAGSTYYVIYIDANTFKLATTESNAALGTAINTSGSQSGVQTYTQSLYGLGDGSTTFNVPDFRDIYARGTPASGVTTGTYRKDAMQGHYHYINQGGGDASAIATFNATGATANNMAAGNPAGTSGGALQITGPLTDGTNGTPRTATETRPVTRYTAKIIKT